MTSAEEFTQAAMGQLMRQDLGSAIVNFQEALIRDPSLAMAWNNRGLCLLQMGHPFDAIMNIERAIELEPSASEYYNNKGACFYELGCQEDAKECYRKAIELKPSFAEAHMNMGNAVKYLGDIYTSIDHYRAAIKAKADYVDAHLNLSFALLATGQYKEGWKEYEWRWKSSQLPPRGLPLPEWDGSSLDGKVILIYGEQGLGDTLQFIRYAQVLKERYKCEVYVEVRQPIVRLACKIDAVDRVIGYGEKIPLAEIDYCCPMMSLPRLCHTTVETVPWYGPYFKADPYRVSLWESKLSLLPPGKRVGICWAGMSRPNIAAANVDKKRSTTLQAFAPLAQVRGISWVSLQKGPPSAQVENPPPGMTIGDWTDELDDFYDTASLIECLDLVITVDTSVVHLAAAMGKPTWLISRWDGCWRWLDRQHYSPWYPTLHHFWQPKPGDWQSVMLQVAEELSKTVPQRNAA